MTDKPEALRLAEFFETDSSSTFAELRAAVELRRLLEVNADLLLALQTLEELLTPHAKTTTELVCLRQARLVIAKAIVK